MISVACILTYRQGKGNARRDNLLAVLRWLASWPDLTVVIVEQDAAPRLDANLPHPNCHHRFVYNAGPFNKSWGMNIGFSMVNMPWLLFNDADIILGNALPKMLEATRSGHHAIKPFIRLLDLDAEESARVRVGDFDWTPSRAENAVPDRERGGEFPPFAGGSILLSRQTFVAMGGWDERFVGWGGEDDAMSYLLERARVPAIELDVRPAVHLQHDRTKSETMEQPNYHNNLRVLESYRQLSDAECERSAEVRKSLIGYADKYRPRS